MTKIGTSRQCFQNILTTPQPAIHDERIIRPDGLTYQGQNIDGGGHAIELAATVIRNIDGISTKLLDLLWRPHLT